MGTKIKTARKAVNLTQEQLAEKSGIIPTTIRKYELGKQKPKLENLRKIAYALDISPYDLVGAAYWDMESGKEKLQKLSIGVKLLEEVENQHGKTASHALGKIVELNPTGQEKALDYIEDLFEQDKYKK